MCVSIWLRADRDTCLGVWSGWMGVSKWRSVAGLEGRHTNDTCSRADKKSGGKSSQVCTLAPPPPPSRLPSPRERQSALVIVFVCESNVHAKCLLCHSCSCAESTCQEIQLCILFGLIRSRCQNIFLLLLFFFLWR